jgi:hypothetical protein
MWRISGKYMAEMAPMCYEPMYEHRVKMESKSLIVIEGFT